MLIEHIADFNIEQIADSGQCFRMDKIENGRWRVRAFNRELEITQRLDEVCFDCSQEEYDAVWKDYFDMSRDYCAIKSAILATGDEYLSAAVKFGYGLRVLRQDLWETLVSFIISQRNNIPRIKSTIFKLCRGSVNFPSAAELAEFSDEELKSCGLGYRAKYVKDIAQNVCNGKFDLEKLRNLDYAQAIDYLKTQNGVGNKVANCVALFGLHKTEAFPIDVWIRRIIDTHYNGHFDTSRFTGYAGIVQQYMFYYERAKGRSYPSINDLSLSN